MCFSFFYILRGETLVKSQSSYLQSTQPVETVGQEMGVLKLPGLGHTPLERLFQCDRVRCDKEVTVGAFVKTCCA